MSDSLETRGILITPDWGRDSPRFPPERFGCETGLTGMRRQDVRHRGRGTGIRGVPGVGPKCPEIRCTVPSRP